MNIKNEMVKLSIFEYFRGGHLWMDLGKTNFETLIMTDRVTDVALDV